MMLIEVARRDLNTIDENLDYSSYIEAANQFSL